MGFLPALFDPTRSRRIDLVCQQIAQRCCPAVWNRAHQRALAMSPAEARGYLRAHAAMVLRSEAAATLASRRLPVELHGKVVEAAGEALVETLLREVIRVQKSAAHRRAPA